MTTMNADANMGKQKTSEQKKLDPEQETTNVADKRPGHGSLRRHIVLRPSRSMRERDDVGCDDLKSEISTGNFS